MPVRFNDHRIASLFSALEARRRSDPSARIDGSQALLVLAAVGDRFLKSSDRVLAELRAPETTRPRQVQIIRSGMDEGEKADLAAILDQGAIPLSPQARSFLEAVLGRESVRPDRPLDLRGIAGDRRDIPGVITPGAMIDAENLGAAPGGSLRRADADTFEKIARADSSGLPPGIQPDARPGHVAAPAGSDGANNTDFRESALVPGAAPVTEDLVPDPAPLEFHRGPDGTELGKKRFTGPLFKEGPVPEDVEQGGLGDCYLAAAMSAIACARPEAIQDMIRENGDGTYTVKFKQKDWLTRRYKDVNIPVDGDLWMSSLGGPIYGGTGGPDEGERTMELWFPLIEKAYAQWKGGYRALDKSGLSSDVFEAVLGVDGEHRRISPENADSIWEQIRRRADNNQPVTAGTRGRDDLRYVDRGGMHPDHAYSVLGYEERDGTRYVKLRNPVGAPRDGRDDGHRYGVFLLKFEDFVRLFGGMMWPKG